jgi:hypothetical protein
LSEKLVREGVGAATSMFSRLALRKDAKPTSESLIRFLAGTGRLYATMGYLPQVSPGHARNFTYWQVLAEPSEEAIVLVRAASAMLGRDDLDSRNPGDVAGSILFWIVYACATAYTGGGVEAEWFEVSIGRRSVRLNALCTILGPGLRMFLTAAEHKYLYYTSDFLLSVLIDFLKSTKTSLCSGCGEWQLRLRSLRDVMEFNEECPRCWEAFRRESTSRISPGLRAALLSLYLYKWIYNPTEILQVTTPALLDVRPRGPRAVYPLTPTYLGRLVSEAIETWRFILVGEDDLNILGNIIIEYFRLFPKVREEAGKILKGSGGRLWANLYRDLESIRNFIEMLEEAQEASPALRRIGAVRTGEIVDDIVGFILNEAVYRIVAHSIDPGLAVFFRYFEGADLESLIYKRILRGVV